MQTYFKGSSLVNENNPSSNEKVLNIYIIYHLDNTSHSFHPKLKLCLFGSVNITKKHSDFNGQGLVVMESVFILTLYSHTQKTALDIMPLFLV